MATSSRRVDQSLRGDHFIVAAVVALTAVLFTANAADPVNVPKLTVLMLGAVALLTNAAYRVVRHRVVSVPVGAPVVAAAGLGVALLAATAVAPTTMPALIGAYGRNSGLLAYGSGLVVFVAVLRSCLRGGLPVIAVGIGVGGLFTAAYGLFQSAGIDAVPWNNPFNPIIAALGNPDFASAYMGITAPVVLGAAFMKQWPLAWRVAAAVTLVLCLVTSLLSGAAQGPLAAAAGAAVVSLALALELPRRKRTAALTSIGGAVAAVAAVVAVGAVLKVGPLASLFTGISFDARKYYWAAALEMVSDRPVFGVGMEQYGGFWRTARSERAVAQLGGANFTDSAHSVPLQMLAQGGLTLGLAYAAFVVVVGIALVVGLRRLRGSERLLLAMFGGAWGAYQVQSVVSIDQVPLMALHFVAAAGVVAAAGAVALRELRLPGALAPVVAPSRAGGRKGRAAAASNRRPRPLQTADFALLGVLGIIAVTLTWASLVPLRANVAAREGDALRNQGNGFGALAAYDRATDLLPGVPYAWVKKAELFAKAEPPQPKRALEAYLAAAKTDPRDPNTRRAAANHAETTGNLEQSRALLREAVALDPRNVETLTAAASFDVRHGAPEQAKALLEDVIPKLDAVARLQAHAPLWATLGDARAALGDTVGARTAYGVAVELAPGQPVAVAGLAALDQV